MSQQARHLIECFQGKGTPPPPKLTASVTFVAAGHTSPPWFVRAEQLRSVGAALLRTCSDNQTPAGSLMLAVLGLCSRVHARAFVPARSTRVFILNINPRSAPTTLADHRRLFSVLCSNAIEIIDLAIRGRSVRIAARSSSGHNAFPPSGLKVYKIRASVLNREERKRSGLRFCWKRFYYTSRVFRNMTNRVIRTLGLPKRVSGRPEVEIDDKWNFLTIMGEAGHNKYHARLVRCQCDCGEIKDISASQIRSGIIVSCGCYTRHLPKTLSYRRKSKYTPDEAVVRHMFQSYRSKAKQYGRRFSLTFSVFDRLVTGNCCYCGRPPIKVYRRPGGTNPVSRKLNGIDRICSTVGYESGNTVSCCWPCNTAKNSMTQDQFRDWIISVYHHWALPSQEATLEDFSI
jgi:hypothetical protein